LRCWCRWRRGQLVASASSAAPSAGAPPSSPPTKETPPASIPVPEVARQAEEVTKTLRDLDALLAPGPAIEGIERRLPDMSARIAAQTEVTTRQLDERPSGPTLDALTALWQTTRVELIGYLDLLTRKATDLEGALQRLTSLRETWSRTRADARTSRAPAPVIERIDSILTAIDASVVRLQRQRAATLVLQDRLAQEMGSCEGVLARIGALRQVLARRLLVRDRSPVWHARRFRRDLADAPDRSVPSWSPTSPRYARALHDQRPRLVLQIVLSSAGADDGWRAATSSRMVGAEAMSRDAFECSIVPLPPPRSSPSSPRAGSTRRPRRDRPWPWGRCWRCCSPYG
jgi:hypothetical protein